MAISTAAAGLLMILASYVQDAAIDDEALHAYKLGLVEDGAYQAVARRILDGELEVNGFGSGDRQVLRDVMRDADRDVRIIEEWSSRYLTEAISSKLWESAVRARSQILADHLSPLLPDDFELRIAELRFQQSFAKHVVSDRKLRDLLDLTPEQSKEIDAFCLGPGLTRDRVNQIVRGGGSVFVSQYVPGVSGGPKPENLSSVRVYRVLTDNQQKLVRRIAGEPVEDGWLRYILDVEETERGDPERGSSER